MASTRNEAKAILNICFPYTSTQEITQTVDILKDQIAKDAIKSEIRFDDRS